MFSLLSPPFSLNHFACLLVSASDEYPANW